MKISADSLHTTFQIHLPASKSISNRVLTINALSENPDMPQNLADCDDTKVMLEWLTARPSAINIGAAGTAMRFSTALLAVTTGTYVITGSQRMKQRPIAVLADSLNSLGAQIEYLENEGFPPLKIHGNPMMQGGELSLRGDVSSQYISALLMVAPMMSNGLTIHLEGNIISRSYIDMTIGVMREFGAVVSWKSQDTIRVEHGIYKARPYFVEADWSASSYWYEILALSDSIDCIFLDGLFDESLQGDAEVASIFSQLGIVTDFIQTEEGKMTARIYKEETGIDFFSYDFVNQPDLAQTLVVTCCMMGIPFRFTGLSTLRIKETDRISALQTELAKLGYDIKEENGSELSWDGSRRDLSEEEFRQVAIDTYDDHRMAMAFAPCCLKMGPLTINHPEVVSKSYPGFWLDLQSAGFQLNF